MSYFRRKAPQRAPLPHMLPPLETGRIQLEGELKQAIETGRNRLVLGGALFALAFGAVALRLVDVAVIKGHPEPRPASAALAASPAKSAVSQRADIVDRNGVVLATSLATASLYANPHQIIDPIGSARKIVEALPELNEAEVRARLAMDKSFVYLRRNLTPRQQQEVNRAGVPGLYFQREERRVYPHGQLTGHIVGLAGIDNTGLSGVEKTLDDVLKDSAGPLRLSLDIRVQHILRDELSAAVERFSALGACGIIMDARSGEIIAMVSLPDYDPNTPGSATQEAIFNRNTLGVYEMGSTFKLFTAAMALDAGVTTLKGGYDASRPIRVSRFTISDYKGKNRWLSVPEIIVYSSNIGAVKMALEVGTEGQRNFLGKLGLLEPARVELPEVGEPLIPSPWREINTMTVSFGHGLSVSPLQLANATAALVNGGMLYPATLVRRPQGAEVPGRRVMKSGTSDQMRWLMRQVVAHGTGKAADTESYPVGGKTGSAEKVSGRGYKEKALLSSFVGAFPIDDPRYVVLAVLDEPHGIKATHGYATGGWVAAPIIKEVVARAAPVLGLTPATLEPEKDPRIMSASARFGSFVKQ